MSKLVFIVDVLSLILLLLFFSTFIALELAAAQAELSATLVILAVFVILMLFIIYVIVKYSAKIKPEPLIPTYDHPISTLGDICEVLEDITPANTGWVRYRGELWRATSVRSVFKKGDIAYVVAIRGTILIIEREPPLRL